MQIEEKDNSYKVSVPLIDEEELKNINNNFDNIINEFMKQYVKDKEMAIAQCLMKKQKEELEKKDKTIEHLKSMNKFQSRDIKEAVDYTFELNKELEKAEEVIDLMAKELYIEGYCKNIKCKKCEAKNFVECIKEHFYKKVEGK